MTIKLLAIGKTDSTELQHLINMYEKRLGYYVKFVLEVIPDLKKQKTFLKISKKRKKANLS